MSGRCGRAACLLSSESPQLSRRNGLYLSSLYMLSRDWQKTNPRSCCAHVTWSLSPISSLCPATSPSQVSLTFPIQVFLYCPCICCKHLWLSLTSATAFPTCAVISFCAGSACWAEREEWVLCYQRSEKRCGANWWWRGMYHGGKAGPRACVGKSISHTSLLHISDKGKKRPNGSSNTADVGF